MGCNFSKENSTSDKKTSVAPHSGMQSGEMVILLVGPLGSDAAMFAGYSANVQIPDGEYESLSGLPRQVLAYEVEHSGRRITLVIPTLFDDRTTEDAVMCEVKEWLGKHRQNHAFVDHIVYFVEVERHFMIKRISTARIITWLKTLCGVSHDQDIYSLVSFVVSMEGGKQPQPLPVQWTSLENQGANKYEFERTADDTHRILTEILQGYRRRH